MYGFGCTLFETEDVLKVFRWHTTEFVWCSMMCNFRFHQLHRLSEEHCSCCTRCWKLRCLWCRVPNWGMFCMGRLDSTAASGCKNWLMADFGLADCEAIRLKMILISHKRNDMKIHEPPRTNGIHLDKWLSHTTLSTTCQTMGSSTCTRCGLGTYRTCRFVWPCTATESLAKMRCLGVSSENQNVCWYDTVFNGIPIQWNGPPKQTVYYYITVLLYYYVIISFLHYYIIISLCYYVIILLCYYIILML